MEGSICYDAYRCGSFSTACTVQYREGKNCGGPLPLKPGSPAIDSLNGLLPEPKIGNCQIGGEKGIPVYSVNSAVDACLKHYVSHVLQNRPMPKRPTKPIMQIGLKTKNNPQILAATA